MGRLRLRQWNSPKPLLRVRQEYHSSLQQAQSAIHSQRNNRKTIQENGRNKRKRDKINESRSATPRIGDKPTSNSKKNDSNNKISQINASNKLPNVNKIRSDNSNNIGKTLPRMIGRRVECGRINSDNSIRIATTDQHNNGVHLKHIDSRLPGRVIAHVAGSPSTAPGSNGAVTTATESQMTVSVVTMAKIMGSASTVCP